MKISPRLLLDKLLDVWIWILAIIWTLTEIAWGGLKELFRRISKGNYIQL